MSQPSPFRRWAVTLSLVAAAAASIATSPAPTLEATLQAPPFTLTAEQPSHTQRLRVRLELDEGREVRSWLHLDGYLSATSGELSPDAGTADAGTVDAGSPPVARPIVQLVVRDAAHPEVELFRGTESARLDLVQDCAERSCEQTLLLEWSLGEGSVSPVSVSTSGVLGTELDPDEGTATLELVP